MANNNLALVPPASPRPERKLSDVVLVFPGNTKSPRIIQAVAGLIVKHGLVFVKECKCGTVFMSGYEVAVQEAEQVHNATLCPLFRKGPKKA